MKSSTQMVLGLVTAAVVLIAAALWLGREDDGAGRTLLRLRIWDDSFVAAYRASLDEFERANPDVRVDVTVVPWASYPQKLRLDVAGGTADDLFWTNLYEDYADAGRLLDIGALLGPEAARAWDPSAVAQYTRNGRLWAVPQFVDGGTAVYYNRELLAAAGVDPAELATLRWSPGEDDTFRPLLRRLAAVAPWAYNAANDFQSINLPYLGSAGGRFQDGGRFVFDGPAGVTAFGYLTRLVADGLAPSAADTNTNRDFAKNAFLQGKLALFQSGTYNLAQIARQATFGWGVAMLPHGPAGRVSTDNAIGVAGNAATRHPDAVRRVLAWLGGAAGNRYLGVHGATIPAVSAVQQVYRDYWSRRGIDVGPFFDVLAGPRIESGGGPGFPAALKAIDPILGEMFLGRIPVPEALARARAAAERAAGPQ
ncbi:sugar ABC transporter substrate-binding protein [Nocardia sp. CDC159]|uniref:Sugar ABC transporter substrate-binding protein n=1 Tax=Nocardia pulmonis TaxID=2951408 RepID=A0A9X2EAC3_9NOCA|nr:MULTISPECIES: sugar ABC transporter substrate-binding protein [Nocardia]MCM6777047.1 sugar ABC transporter substrate-binding protein [Nocardia pulmonis]MCM6789471.1 sugar ABC transporter substrate-binding protein [Nocardia sp. CDC159]